MHVSDMGTGSSYVLRGHAGPVSDAAFSPDARWLATAGPTVAGHVCTDAPALIRLAEHRLAATGRTSSPSERRAYLDAG